MATTTTIYPTDDTHIREPNPTTNYGTGIYLPMGEWSGGRRHALLEFDVSSFTKPSDIVSANFSLTAISSSGGSTRNMTLARLDQSFVDTSATWNTYNGVDTWVTAGAEDNAATTQPTYTIQVGSTTNQTVDIKPLVIDAINKRAGVLLLVIFLSSGASAYTTFGSTDNLSTPNKPSLAVTVATRIVWSGAAGDGDVSESRNWEKGVAPTTSDIAIFNDGDIDVTTGQLSCYSCYISESYTGSIGTTADAIRLLSDTSLVGGKFVFKKKRGLFNFDEYSDSGRGVYIANTSEDDNTFANGLGAWNCFVHRTNGQFIIEGNSNLVTGSDNNSKKVTTFGTQTEMVIGNNTKATLENGSLKSHIVNAKVKCKSGVLFNGADSFIAANSYVSQLGSSMGNVQILEGTLSFKDNENGSIESEDIHLWGNGIFDSRTTTGSWDTHADPSIIAKGGNFVVDVGRTLTITN